MDTVQVCYQGKAYTCAKNRPLLFTLQEQGVLLPSSCQNGFCQACMGKLISGTVPKAAQAGLDEHLKAQGCFLPCICKPQEGISFELATKANLIPKPQAISPFAAYQSMVVDKTRLNRQVIRLCLMKPEGLAYKAGQWINLVHPKSGIKRSYSLASLPCENFLELHIRHIANGHLSGWVAEEVRKGDMLSIEGPAGDCYYQQDDPKQTLILAGVGTGLAPLYGILRDALESEHTGQIVLFHAGRDAYGLYYQDEIQDMVNTVDNLTYIPVVQKGDAPAGGKQGDITQVMAHTLGDCAGSRAYVCGDDAVVQRMKNTLLACGVHESDILSDAFTPSV